MVFGFDWVRCRPSEGRGNADATIAVRLGGAVAIVTGASRGIGRATAVALAAAGATVVCVGRDEQALRNVSETIAGSVVVTDVTSPGAAEAIVAATLQRHGRIDVVVANAGAGYAGKFADMPMDRIAELIELNVRAPLQLAAASLPHLGLGSAAAHRGALVFVSSVAGALAVPDEAVYSATKAALNSFASVLAVELRPRGISVSTVLPGVVETDFFTGRGLAYDRRFPRPLPADRVARTIVTAARRGTVRRIQPRWLGIPITLSAAAPRLYRALERHLG